MMAERNTLEWAMAWEGLRRVIVADRLGDGTDLAQRSALGECWQYMGTIDQHHGFRHRDHPVTGGREYRWVPANNGAPLG